MQMTEKEATEKWCPFTRYVSDKGEAINRWGLGTDKSLNPILARCIGSACMAWKWAEHEEFEYRYAQMNRPEGEGWVPYSDAPTNCAWKRPHYAARAGFCGLTEGKR